MVVTVLDEAQNIGGIVTAARARERWMRAAANNTDPERQEALREAVADLEARFPELEEIPPGGAEGLARERGHGTRARSPVRHGRQRLQPSQPAGGGARAKKKGGGLGGESKAAKGGKPAPGLDPGARRSPAERKAAAGAPTPRVDKAIRQTEIPSTFAAGTSATMLALGATVGMALLYLVVSSAEKKGSGAAAVPNLIESVTGFLGRFLSLSDIFPSTPPPTVAAAAAAAAGRTPAPSRGDARREGKKLLPRVQRMPRRPTGGARPIHFNPDYVTGGGGG